MNRIYFALTIVGSLPENEYKELVEKTLPFGYDLRKFWEMGEHEAQRKDGLVTWKISARNLGPKQTLTIGKTTNET